MLWMCTVAMKNARSRGKVRRIRMTAKAEPTAIAACAKLRKAIGHSMSQTDLMLLGRGRTG